MRYVYLMITGLLTIMPALAQAQPDLEAGKATFATCMACHGANGEGNVALKAPRLAHLAPVYIVAQLNNFKQGIRGGEGATDSAKQMAGMAGTVADEQAMINVASYIASLDAPATTPTLEGDAAVGADYYNQLCGACHGGKAEGNIALHSPALAGADDWYLLAQLQAFRSGERGSHPDDRTGKQMKAMAAVIPDDKTMADIVVFLRDSGS